MSFTPKNGGETKKWVVYDYEGAGVGMAMYNTDSVSTAYQFSRYNVSHGEKRTMIC